MWKTNEEKKADVNVAVRLLQDADDDLFDTALVVSGDGDLVPPIEPVHTTCLIRSVPPVV